MLKDLQIADIPNGYISNGQSSQQLAFPDGVQKDLTIHLEGPTGGPVTSAAEDPELGILQRARLTIPMKRRPPIVIEADPRDFKQMGFFWGGTLAPAVSSVATTGNLSGVLKILFAPPDVVTENDDIYGIPSDEIAGYGTLDITWNPAAIGLGTGGTIVQGAIKGHISVGVNVGANVKRPLACLVFSRNRVAQIAAVRSTQNILQTGNAQFLVGMFIKQMQAATNSSVVNDKKVDGLVTRFMIDHSTFARLIDEHFSILKTETQLMFKAAAGDMPAGCAMLMFSNKARLNEMPTLMGGQQLTAILDSAEAETADIAAVTPQNGDYVNMVVIGAQLTEAGQAFLAKGGR
jgi:hypothetical protein